MDEDFAAALAADMTRLGERPYSEVGVPMFLVADDLTSGPGVAPDLNWTPIAAEFEAMTKAVARERGELTDAHLARVIEVLADRHIVGVRGPFTTLSDAR